MPRKAKKSKQGLSPRSPAPDQLGNTRGFMDLPLEMVAKVVSTLQPLDLLHLARTSKSLRYIFMSRSCRSMWVMCLSNVPAYQDVSFPMCPPDLSEPAYSSLVFESRCLTCGYKKALQDLTFRERICKRCMFSRLPRRGIHDFVKVCKISGVTADETHTIFSLLLFRRADQFSQAGAQMVYRQCVSTKAQVSESQYQEYLAGRQAAMELIRTHAVDLARWYDLFYGHHKLIKLKEESELARRRARRCMDISARLCQIGWRRKDFPEPASDRYKQWEKIVHCSKPLTQQVWTGARPLLERILWDEREARVRKITYGLAAP